MTKRTLTKLILMVLLVLALAGCGQVVELPEPPTEEPIGEPVFCQPAFVHHSDGTWENLCGPDFDFWPDDPNRS